MFINNHHCHHSRNRHKTAIRCSQTSLISYSKGIRTGIGRLIWWVLMRLLYWLRNMLPDVIHFSFAEVIMRCYWWDDHEMFMNIYEYLMNVCQLNTMNVHERSSKCSWGVHEYSWITNETFMKIYEFMNLFCSWTLIFFVNLSCLWMAMNSYNSWIRASSPDS